MNLRLTVVQLVVRNIENDVKARLQRRAKRNRCSMEEEVRNILRAAVHMEESALSGGLGTRLSKIFAGHGLDSPIQQLRGWDIKPPSFEE